MEFTEEFVKEQNLSPEQVTAITTSVTGHYDPHIAELKKGWDGTALTNAENIISDAVTATQTANNFTLDRPKGEKLKDWLVKYSAALNESSQSKLDKSIKEYDDKVTNFEGDSNLKAEIITLKEKLDPLQKKEADYEALLNSGFKEKFETLEIEHKGNLRNVAFSSVRPAFHQDANKYEVDAIWNKSIAKIEGKYDLVEVDGKWLGVDKENKYTQVPLEDLVKNDETLTTLISGRKQDPLNGKPSTESRTIEGVPFPVPKDADSSTITKLIKDHLLTEGIDSMHADFSKKFSELNRKVRTA